MFLLFFYLLRSFKECVRCDDYGCFVLYFVDEEFIGVFFRRIAELEPVFEVHAVVAFALWCFSTEGEDAVEGGEPFLQLCFADVAARHEGVGEVGIGKGIGFEALPDRFCCGSCSRRCHHPNFAGGRNVPSSFEEGSSVKIKGKQRFPFIFIQYCVKIISRQLP